MITDYTLLAFAKADLELYQELDTPYPPNMIEGAVLTILEYLLDRDKPKRELVLMQDKIKTIKKEVKKQTGMKAKNAIKKQVKGLGKLPKSKKKAAVKKKYSW